MLIYIMFSCIVSSVQFLGRTLELQRLSRAHRRAQGALVVISGRRRVGKTRLLLEWVKNDGGVYTVADESSAVQQRVATAESFAQVFPGFADVTYPNWQSLLSRVSQAAKAISFRGPIIFDELPYLVTQSPELPSVLQKWFDHEAKAARLSVAIAGSSQRMMQGLFLRPLTRICG